jgi:Family of unknown function (DUF6346)
MRALAFGLAAVVGFLSLATVIRTTDVLVGSPEAARTGTATVASCTEHGPVGRWGVGMSTECVADVRWEDGGTARVTFPPGQLEPGDREVPVFESGLDAGRNDSARWTLAGPVLAVVLGLLTVWFAAATIGSLIPRRGSRRAASTAEPESTAESTAGSKAESRTGSTVEAKAGSAPGEDERWPVSKAEVAAAPVPRRVRRLRLIAWLALGAGGAELLASMPFFDGPRRAGGFVSPWPELESAWLVDPPSGVITGFGVVVAAMVGLIASLMRRDVARIVKYGQPYLDTKRAGTRQPGTGWWVPTVVLVALVVLAVVSAVRAVPADAPVPVWLAGGRDAVVLFALLVIVLATRQSTKDMTERLSRNSREPQVD